MNQSFLHAQTSFCQKLSLNTWCLKKKTDNNRSFTDWLLFVFICCCLIVTIMFLWKKNETRRAHVYAQLLTSNGKRFRLHSLSVRGEKPLGLRRHNTGTSAHFLGFTVIVGAGAHTITVSHTQRATVYHVHTTRTTHRCWLTDWIWEQTANIISILFGRRGGIRQTVRVGVCAIISGERTKVERERSRNVRTVQPMACAAKIVPRVF